MHRGAESETIRWLFSFGGLLSRGGTTPLAPVEDRFGALFSQLISSYWWLLPLFVLISLALTSHTIASSASIRGV